MTTKNDPGGWLVAPMGVFVGLLFGWLLWLWAMAAPMPTTPVDCICTCDGETAELRIEPIEPETEREDR